MMRNMMNLLQTMNNMQAGNSRPTSTRKASSNRPAGNMSGCCMVHVLGYDYGTTNEQIENHMSSVGTVVEVNAVDQKSVIVTYSSADEATAAQTLDGTNIAGNSRYIEVTLFDPQNFLAGHNIEDMKAKQFLALPVEQQQVIMARGSLASARDPTAVLVQRMKSASGSGMAFNSGGLAGGSSGGSVGGDCSVLVRGFDYGTSNDQIADHMSQAGTIKDVKLLDAGSVCITYGSAMEATYAAEAMNGTNIAGNSRYIDVLVLDAAQFLAGLNIEMEKQVQFSALTPQQQLAVMAKGSLASARDANAVLVKRMSEVRGNSSGKSFNFAGGSGGSIAGKCSVLVRGFDYGTSINEIAVHMSSAGTVQDVKTVDQGSVAVTYASEEEATYAAESLNATNIAGNNRYIDVVVMDPMQFLAGHNIEIDKMNQFSALTPQQQQDVMAKGSLASARDPNAVLVKRMNEARGKAGGSGSGSNFAGSFGGMGGSFSGKNSVLVRGFDFGTTDEQITNHMSGAGTVQDFKHVDKGSVCVTYISADEATYAAQTLNGTNISGNSRYLDVIVMDPMQFLSGSNIDKERAQQFMAMTPEQQQVVMAKGSLASARDPTAVLVQRMKQAKGAGKGSFGPAGGCGGGNSSGPYGGSGGGSSTDSNAMMMKMMEMMMKNMASGK